MPASSSGTAPGRRSPISRKSRADVRRRGCSRRLRPLLRKPRLRPLCVSHAVLADIWVNRSWRQIVVAETIACSSRTRQGAFRQRVFASVEGLPWRPTAL